MSRIVIGFVLALLLAAAASAQNCQGTTVGLVPVTDLLDGTYKGYRGGLYPGGVNFRPPAHDAAGLREAAGVVPRNAAGRPDPQRGRIVLLSIGMSNTTQEFQEFLRLVRLNPAVNPRLVVVDGAQGGQSAQVIVNPNARFWSVIDQRLQQAGVSRAQVQAVWFKEANPRPTQSFPSHAQILQRQFETIMGILRSRYPNARLCYLSSRIYAGYATTRLNPEPYAYESAFAVKWLLADQIQGKPSLNYDPARGTVRAPWLAWGPYLWADGLSPRSDGLVYLCADFARDGTHPARGARTKVARMLLDFFATDATTRPWFLARPPAACAGQARVVPLGAGVGGRLGPPRLAAGLLPTVPTPGLFRLQAWRCPPRAPGLFVAGLQPIPGGLPFLGGRLYVQVLTGFPAVTDTWGKAAWILPPIPPNPSWCGLTLYFQFGVFDPTAPKGFGLSRALRVTVGH